MVDGPDSAWRNRAPGPHTQKRSEAGYGRPVDRGVWTAKTVKRPRQQPAHPQCANYWAPLTRKRHTMPHSAQSQHTNHWAPRTRKRHQQEHWPQRPTESSDPTQHAKGRTGDRPGPRKGATTRRNVTQGAGGGGGRGRLVQGGGDLVAEETCLEKFNTPNSGAIFPITFNDCGGIFPYFDLDIKFKICTLCSGGGR